MSDGAGFDDVAVTTELLRTEVIAAQAARTDLLKYKLFVMAILGAVAVGVGPATSDGRLPHVVGIIPFACLYIDAVCDHNDIRILMIARFLHKHAPSSMAAAYEDFASERREVFSTEKYAIHVGTFLVSMAIAAAGVLLLAFGEDPDATLVTTQIGTGSIGMAGSWALMRRTRKLIGRIADPPEG